MSITDWLIKRSEFLKNIFQNIKQEFLNINSKTEKLEQRQSEQDAKIARLEGMVAILASKSQSQSQSSLRDVSETRLIQRVKRASRKSDIIKSIKEMLEKNVDIATIKAQVVDLKQLCSKATFYRYVSSLSLSLNKSHLRQI